MNVDHVQDAIIPTVRPGVMDRLDLIFNRQLELMVKYHDIEDSSGLLQTPRVPATEPVPIHDRFGQARLKDFAWRVTEELTESTWAMLDHPDIVTHKLEELSDAYHFLTELNILSGLDANSLTNLCIKRAIKFGIHAYTEVGSSCKLEALYKCTLPFHPPIDLRQDLDSQDYTELLAYRVVAGLGRAMNCLKQKPWKQTHMLTDVDAYYEGLVIANMQFLVLASECGLNADALYRIYFKKSEVNKFRQRSNY